MSRSAQTLQATHEVAFIDRPRSGPALRPPGERALLIAVWAGVVVFSLAFWAAVMAICVA